MNYGAVVVVVVDGPMDLNHRGAVRGKTWPMTSRPLVNRLDRSIGFEHAMMVVVVQQTVQMMVQPLHVL